MAGGADPLSQAWWNPPHDASEAFGIAGSQAARVGLTVGSLTFLPSAISVVLGPNSMHPWGREGTLFFGLFSSSVLAALAAFGAFLPLLWHDARGSSYGQRETGWVVVPSLIFAVAFGTELALRPLLWLGIGQGLPATWFFAYAFCASACLFFFCPFLLRWRRVTLRLRRGG